MKASKTSMTWSVQTFCKCWMSMILALAVSIPTATWGQTLPGPAAILRGIALPLKPQAQTWFYNTGSFQLLLFREGEWVLKGEGPFTEIDDCHGSIILHTPHGLQVTSGEHDDVAIDIENLFCSDSILGYEMGGTIFFRNHLREVISIYSIGQSPCDQPWKQWTLQGEPAFCLPAYFRGSMQFGCRNLRNWGYLGGNGRWLISPIYDEPFEFQNGIAEVVYYGQKRKINTLGEFVE